MEIQEGYNLWSGTYDTVENKTRDLEQMVLQKVVPSGTFHHILELGCGTGKNTSWLSTKCSKLTAVDFSEGMIKVAKQKEFGDNVNFQQADITLQWTFDTADVITCSLILEHIAVLDHIFQQANQTLSTNGIFYICELHPYKQLAGKTAEFTLNENLIQLPSFTHNLSEFFNIALANGFQCQHFQEWFDDEKQITPRLCSFIFQKGL